MNGVQGSAGAGFADFQVEVPSRDFRIDRGTFAAIQMERGFGVLNLYFTMTLSQLNAEGTANYKYTNLASTTVYEAKDVNFTASFLDLGLGFKLKLIDDYWFRPYIEAGGSGGYYELAYRTKMDVLNAQGNDWKPRDVIMGAGYYGEGGLEIAFSEKFGIKFAVRLSDQSSKELVTQNSEKLRFKAETYYLSALVGF